MKYLLFLSILMCSVVSNGQAVRDTSFPPVKTLQEGTYIMRFQVRPIENEYIFGFIPYSSEVSVLPLVIAFILIGFLFAGFVGIIYEKLTLKKSTK